MVDKPYTSEAETSIKRGLFAMLKAILKAMRPRQWTKNAVVFAALVFDRQLLFPGPFLRTLAGFVIFCMLSGVVYIINDIADVDADKGFC